MQADLIFEEKRALRKKYLGIRDSLSPTEKADSDLRILNALLSLDEYKKASVIFAYASKGSEADTFGIIKRALDDNKAVALPKCKSGGEMDFYFINSLNDLEPGCFGVLEPKASLKRADSPEGLCIVPALAYSKGGIRLGYGKGYYDRFLPRFKGIAAGLCHHRLLTDKLPFYSTDYKVSLIITDKGIYITK